MNAKSILIKLTWPAQKAGGWLWLLTSTKALLVFLPIGLVFWGIWVCPSLHILPSIVISDSTPYLLSAIAQSLSAILALVFTISLIAVQLSSRYSYRIIIDFLDPFTVAYILLFIITVILSFWFLSNPSLNGLKLSFVLAAVCLFLLVPYFIGFREKLSTEYILLGLKNRALKDTLANSNTEPASVAVIDDITTQALALKDYGTFGEGIRTLGDLLYQAEKLHSHEKVGFKFENVSRIYNRLDDIAIGTMDDHRAREYVKATLWRIAEYSTNDGLGWTTMRLVHEFHRLSLKAIEKGLKDAAAGYVSFIHLVSSLGMLRDVKYLNLDEVAELLHSVGVETAKREMDLPLRQVISSLGEIAGDSIKKDIRGLASKVAVYLGNIISEVGRRGLTEEVEQANYCILLLGASAVNNMDEELRLKANEALRASKKAAGLTTINSALQKAEIFVGHHWGYLGTKADLDEFAKSFEWLGSNDTKE